MCVAILVFCGAAGTLAVNVKYGPDFCTTLATAILVAGKRFIHIHALMAGRPYCLVLLRLL